MRLVKFLTLCVAMSRNQGKFFIRKGRVSVDGKVKTDPDFELPDPSHVLFDGKPISVVEHQYVVLHKPRSFVCAADDEEYTSVLELVKNRSVERRYYFANALGPEITGLVLLSDDIRWTSRMRLRLQKKTCIYHVRSENRISEDQLQQLKDARLASTGDMIGPTIDIHKTDDKTLLLSVSHARATEITAILSSVGLGIDALQLRKLGRLSLGDLKEGDCLELAENDIKI